MPAWLVHVGYRGKTGNHLLVVSFTGFDLLAVRPDHIAGCEES
jgi:hypothetical protein